MKIENLFLLIGLILTIIGLIKIDKFLIPTLDYFGKYVFFGLFNVFCLYLPYYFFKKFKGINRLVMPILIGVIILLIGIKEF